MHPTVRILGLQIHHTLRAVGTANRGSEHGLRKSSATQVTHICSQQLRFLCWLEIPSCTATVVHPSCCDPVLMGLRWNSMLRATLHLSLRHQASYSCPNAHLWYIFWDIDARLFEPLHLLAHACTDGAPRPHITCFMCRCLHAALLPLCALKPKKYTFGPQVCTKPRKVNFLVQICVRNVHFAIHFLDTMCIDFTCRYVPVLCHSGTTEGRVRGGTHFPKGRRTGTLRGRTPEGTACVR